MHSMKATGSQIIVKLLELEGIKTVAGLPGGYILPLYDELNRSSITHVLVRQEQAAGFIAQGIARSTGTPAVCMVTSGPGVMNLLTAVADARCDSVPIIAFTGQVNTSLIGTDAFQEADTFGLSFPITKHSMMVTKAKDLFTAIPKAFTIATSGRPGPVLIDLPKDVQTEVVEFEKWPTLEELHAPLGSLTVNKFASPKKEIETSVAEMAAALKAAEKPVIFAGGGCNNPEASKVLNQIADAYECTMTSSLMGIGVFPKSNKRYLGMVGMHGSLAANKAMYQADVILACGVRFDDRATGVIKEFCPNAKILHIDVDAAEINKIIPSAISVCGDVREVLPLLLKELSSNTSASKERSAWCESLVKENACEESDLVGRCENVPQDSLNPRTFLRTVPDMAKKAGVDPSSLIVTTDVGQHQMWTAQYYPVEKARQLLTSGSLGTMGFGLPAAIGASLSNRDKRVLCMSGDGSILMNIQELATLREQNLDVTVFIFQNGSLGMVRQQQMYLFNKNYSASEFQMEPDFITIAKGFGIDGVCVNDDPDWYKKAFTKGPHLVVIKINIDENVLPFVAAGHANIDPLV